jgi:hypothetical protein
MKKLLLLSALLIFACSSDEGNDNTNLFRNIYSNTFWTSEGGLITFSPDKLWYGYFPQDLDGCGFLEEGSFENILVNDCFFENVTYSVINEDSNMLSIIGVYSGGSADNNSNPCVDHQENIIFQIINDDVLEVSQNDEGFIETNTFLRSNNTFSTSDCNFIWY